MNELAFSLEYSGIRFDELIDETQRDILQARETETGIDEIESMVDRMLTTRGVPPPLSPLSADSFQSVPHNNSVKGGLSYHEVVEEARAGLRRRGMEPESVAIETVLPERVYRQLRSRFETRFSLQTKLDRYDIGLLFLAGLAGAMVDWLMVGVPKKVGFLGSPAKNASGLSGWLKSLEVNSDNPLSNRFKSSYDYMPTGVRGMNPSMHRLHSLGHDPLVGLAVGVFDIMRGSATILDANGHLHQFTKIKDPLSNPLFAAILHMGHLLSDAFTPMGLPAPGWSLLSALKSGSVVYRERTVGEITQIMYRSGYDFRHFLAMATAPAATEIILLIYFAVRKQLDPDFKESLEREKTEAGASTCMGSERYVTMALLAHLIVTSSNSVRIAVQGPMSLNYPEWIRFLLALTQWTKRRLANPTEVLLRGSQGNARMILEGWAGIDDVSDPVPSQADFKLLR